MKARIKETGAIVDVFYNAFSGLWTARENTNIKYLENNLEFLEEKDIDWEERRYEIAKAMMTAFEKHNNNVSGFKNSTQQAQYALECADALIAELKKGGEK